MPRIGTGRYANFLRRYLQLAGANVGGDLVPDLNAVFDIHALPEFGFLQGVRYCMARAVRAGVIAERSGMRLRNPGNSGVIATLLTGEALSAQTSDTVTMGVGTFLNSVGGSGRARDFRWEPGGTMCVLEAGRITGLTGFAEWRPQFGITNLIWYGWDNPIVLNPGQEIQWQNGTDNIALTSSVCWIERQALAEELTP